MKHGGTMRKQLEFIIMTTSPFVSGSRTVHHWTGVPAVSYNVMSTFLVEKMNAVICTSVHLVTVHLVTTARIISSGDHECHNSLSH